MNCQKNMLILSGILAGALCGAAPVLVDDFEGDLSANWKGIGPMWTNSKNAASGNQAIQRVFYPKTPEGSVSMIPCMKTFPVPREKFGFSIQASGGDQDGSAITQALVLEFIDQAGKSLGKQEYPLKTDRSSYQKTEQEITAPAGAVKFRPYLKAQFNKTQPQIAYVRFDDLKITTWDEQASAAYAATNADVRNLDLLFDLKGAGWELTPSWRITSGAHGGNGCVEFISSSSGAANGSIATLKSQAPLPVQGGQEYRLSFFVTTTEKTLSTKHAVEVTFLDAEGKTVGNVTTRPIVPPPTRWMESAKLITAPANAVAAKLSLHVIAMKEITKPFRAKFDTIRLPLWEVEKQLALPRGPKPAPIQLEDPDSGKVTSGNLGIGKFYQADRDPMPEYQDIYPNRWTLGSKLTDGKISSGTAYKKPAYVAWRGKEPFSITVDLGRTQTLEDAEISGFKDYEAGFVVPESFTVSVSSDKENWTEWSSWKNTQKDVPDGSYQYAVKAAGTKARYVRVTVQPQDGTKPIVMLDEITLNGKIKNTWKYVPANGSYHGAFPPTYGIKEPLRAGRKKPMSLDIYEKVVGKKLSMVLWYQGISPERAFSELQVLRLNEMMENNYGQRFMSLGWLPPATVKLQDIISGKLDEYFTEYFSDSIDDAYTYGDKTPIWLRPMNEFNAGWVNWGLDPESFLPAWRRMYNIAEQIGAAERHIFVWSPNHRSYPDVEWNKMEKYYPGDQYVDWVGLSCYPPSRQYTDSEDARYPIGRIKELSDKYGDRKPMMIAEGGYDEEARVSRLRWVKEWFEFQKVYPNCKAMIWENHGTRVIQDGGEALELYRKEVQNPYWISETYIGE